MPVQGLGAVQNRMFLLRSLTSVLEPVLDYLTLHMAIRGSGRWAAMLNACSSGVQRGQ